MYEDNITATPSNKSHQRQAPGPSFLHGYYRENIRKTY